MGAKKFEQLFICLLICVLILSACAKREAEDETWLIINDIEVFEDEVMLYLLQTASEFEELGGDDVWQIKDFSGSMSASEVAKQGALDNLIKVKILATRLEEAHMEIPESVKNEMMDQSKRYFEGLSETFTTKHKITTDSVYHVLEENQKAKQMEEQVMANYEINHDEVDEILNSNSEFSMLKDKDPAELLTSYKVLNIVVYTHYIDELGEKKLISENSVEMAKSTIEEAYKAVEDGKPFEEAVKDYTEEDMNLDSDLSINVSRFRISEAFGDALSRLEDGEISGILEDELGYYLFKRISMTKPSQEMVTAYKERFDEWEQALIIDISQTLMKEAFDKLYSKWLKNATVAFENPWSEVDMLDIIGE